MKLSFSGSGDLARGGFDLWDVRAVAGSVLGFLQEAGARPEGGRRAAWCTEPDAGRALASSPALIL